MEGSISLRMSRIDLEIELPFQLGPGRVYPSAYEYVAGGIATRMQPQTVKVLVALHHKVGQVVTRNELIDRCWGGRIIGDDVINRSIALLRRVAEKSQGFEIETVPKIGYRLVGARSEPSKRRVPRPWVVVPLFGLLALAFLSSSSFKASTQRLSDTPTIAVAAFGAASSESAALLQASKIRGQIVDALVDIGLPARRLDTGQSGTSDYIVSGQIDAQPDAIRTLIQIADSRTGITILSQKLDIDPTEKTLLADKIAAATAGAMSSTAFELLSRRNSDPAESAQALESVGQMNSGNYLGAYAMARQLVQSQPKSPIAPFLLAWTSVYALRELPVEERPAALLQARAAARLSVDRLPHFGDARIAQCRLYPLNYMNCERIYRAALKIDPSARTVPALLAAQLMNAGRFKESLSLAEQSETADPFNAIKVQHRLYLNELLGLAGEEKLVWDYGQRYWPKSRFARQRFVGLMAAGRWKEAQVLLPEVGRMEPDSANTLKTVFDALNSRDTAASRNVRPACGGELDAAAFITCLTGLSMLGLPGEGLEVAMRQFPAVVSHSRAEAEAQFLRDGSDPGPLFLLWGDGARAMRRQPAFAVLAKRAGLIAYWRSNGAPDFCRTEPAPVCKKI